jgi:hypothetical protein
LEVLRLLVRLLLGFRFWLLWQRPLDLLRQIDAFCGDPLVETLVEFFVVDVEGWSAFAGLHGEDFGFAFLAVLSKSV